MALAQFVREYRIVRRAEGWGSPDANYYRALPYQDLTGRFEPIWRIRARSFDRFMSAVLLPLEAQRGILKVIDLGAGCGWLSYRLRSRGHAVLPIDLLDDEFDGLRAIPQFCDGMNAVIAEFDRLPLADSYADLAVFNASFHYSTDYAGTLRECLRVLEPRGTLVILDSPMYSDPTSGIRMVQEREARFQATYGFASNSLAHEHFLTPARLATIGNQLGITWRTFRPRLDVATTMQRRFNGLRARREPASFPVLVGTRT